MTTTAKVMSKEVSTSHGKIRYLEAGTGAPLILLHGAGVAGGADDFRPAIDLLSPHLRAIAPDFPTWPPSDAARANMQAFPDLTDFVREFQDVLGLRSSHVLGATMGGWIAGLLAYESPERVDKLIMTGNPGFHGSANDRLAQFQIPSEENAKTAVDRVSGMLNEGERAALVKDKLSKLNEPGYADAHGGMMKTMADHENRKLFNLMRRLPFVTAPTLLLLGRHDPTSEMADELKGVISGSKVVIIETGGHQVHYENTEEFSKAVVEFLK